MDLLERINSINDYYGHQKNLDEVYGIMREYTDGVLLYEASHIVISIEVFIRIKEMSGTHILFASYYNKNDDWSKKYTCMRYLTQQEAHSLVGFAQSITEIEWREPDNKRLIILDGIWDCIMIYGSEISGYKWGENPVSPYHVLQEFANTIYSFLPPHNGHVIGRISKHEPHNERYQGLIQYETPG